MPSKVSRRQMLKSMAALLIAAPLAQACAPKAVEAPAPAQKPAEQATAAPAKVEATKPAAPAGAKTTITMAAYADPRYDWMRSWAKKWGEQHPEVDLKVEDVVYADMAKKQLAQLATGTLWDITYSGIKFYSYSVAKGCFKALDDLIAAKDPGMDDMLDAARFDVSFDGKVYGLPYMYHPGNAALVFINLDLLGEKGIATPTDDWKVSDFAEIAAKTVNKDKMVFGTTYLPGNYYDFTALTRTFGSEIFDADGKKILLDDPKVKAAALWTTELRTKHNAAPKRDESEGLQFGAGNVVLQHGGTYSLKPNATAVGDKFKFEAVLFPTSDDGNRWYQGFTEMFSIAATCKAPELAFDLMSLECSQEVGKWSVLNNDFNPNARKSVWSDPDVLKVFPIFERALKMMTAKAGPFPMPYNLRFSELNNVWANTSPDMFYGDVDFEEGIKNLQSELQAIMDQPRP